MATLDHHKYLEFIRRKISWRNPSEKWHAPELPLIKVLRTDWAEPPDEHPEMPSFNALDMWGQLGHCGELITFASGGLYWGEALVGHNKEKFFPNGPQDFTVEVWKKLDPEGRHLKHLYDIIYRGVKWLHVYHAGNDGTSDCWGIAHCTYEERTRVERNDEECLIPDSEQYPSLYITRLIEEHRIDIPLEV